MIVNSNYKDNIPLLQGFLGGCGIMSNHAGGYMLATMLKEFSKIGLFEIATQEQRTQIAKALWRLSRDYDCNWGEILDTEMALLLNACLYCGKTDAVLYSDGLCAACSKELNGPGCSP